MGQYSKAIITAAGQSLIAKAIAGEAQINITKAKTSDYKYPDDTDFKALTDMEGIKQVLEFPETKVLGNDLIQTRVLFSNEEIKATYYIHNIGLYANDGTKEVLFCIVTTDVPDEMPQYNGVAATSYIYNIQNVIKDAETIHITVSPVGNATIQDVMERVDSTGGDISETVIEKLEPIDTKYPVPSAGESTKVFMGKVKKYIEDTKPLDADMFVYVATTGSNTTGNGTSSKPYKTITYALSTIPKAMNGHTVGIVVAEGIYAEDVSIQGVDGDLQLLLQGEMTIINSLTVTQSYLTIGSFTGSEVLLTTQWVAIKNASRVFANASVDFNVVDKVVPSFTASTHAMYCFDSQVYLSGILALTGNPYFGIAAYANSNVFLGTVTGAGMTVGITADRSKIACLSNKTTATNHTLVQYGAVLVNGFGAKIGTLSSNVTIYVATTGSDTAGNGSSAKPYKTIQYALDVLPKDLGGFTALIFISDGTYVEDIMVSAFYNGYVVIKRNVADADQVINNLCNIRSVHVAYCTSYVDVHGINITASNIEGAVVEKCPNVTTFFRCQSVVDDGSANSYAFNFQYCNRGRVIQCHTQNKRSAILARNTQVVSDTWYNSTSTKGVALVSAEAGSITTIGVQPSSPGGNTAQLSGGSFFKDNGTQISGVISSGLSCSWGTIAGGYVRHGNLNGTAMVTINIRVTTTSVLSARATYFIYGFPTTEPVSVAVACQVEGHFSHRALTTIGRMDLTVTSTIDIPTGNIYQFSATYLTNS